MQIDRYLFLFFVVIIIICVEEVFDGGKFDFIFGREWNGEVFDDREIDDEIDFEFVVDVLVYINVFY